MVDTKFIKVIRYDVLGFSVRKFKSGRKWVRLRIDDNTLMIYIVEAKTHQVLELKQFKGKNDIAFHRAAKVMLQKYIGHVFPKMQKRINRLKGNVSKDWVKT